MSDLNFNKFIEEKKKKELKVPEVILTSFEKLFESVIPSVIDDPLVQLRMINFIKSAIETTYLMGMADGQRLVIDNIKYYDKEN